MTRLSEARAQELIEMASELVCRVRDVDPERNGTWLASLTAQDRWELLFVLAAMVDPSVPLSTALAWTWPLERFGRLADLEVERHVRPDPVPRLPACR